MRRATWLVLLLACQRPPTFQGDVFVCTSAGECADGFVCEAGVCSRSGAQGGGSVVGGGAVVAGGAGGGGVVGGGSVAGGGVAGGSVAGGSVGGGSAGGTGGGVAGGAPSMDGGLGSACLSATGCAPGLSCVDMTCCESACGSPCDVCNAAGSRGRCVTAPAGTACGLFVCDGRSTSCPTQCTPTSGCANGSGCTSAGQCARCWGSFTDDFSTGANQWTLMGANISGVLRLEVQARPNRAEQVTAQVTMPNQLRGCGVSVELSAQPDVTTGFVGKVGLFPVLGTTPSFRWDLDGRGLVAAWSLGDGGTGAMVVAGPSTTWPRWLRIEESNGQVRFRTSSGAAFTTAQSVAHGELLESTVLRVEAGYPQQPGNDRTALALDNVNLGP